MNKKGQIAEAMLPIIAVALVIYTGFAFVGLFNGFEASSKDYNDLMTRAKISEEHAKNVIRGVVIEIINENPPEDLKLILQKEVENRNISEYDGRGNFLGKIRNGDFIFEKRGNNYYIEIRDLFVQAEVGNNKIKRNFNITESISSSR